MLFRIGAVSYRAYSIYIQFTGIDGMKTHCFSFGMKFRPREQVHGSMCDFSRAFACGLWYH